MPRSGASLSGVGSLTNAIDGIKDRWTTSVSYSVGTNVSYSIHVEYGTSEMAAQPYLRPAAEQAKRDVPAIAAGSDSIDQTVQRVALRVEDIAKRVVPVDSGNLRSSIAVQEL